jgi:hypothetical protein
MFDMQHPQARGRPTRIFDASQGKEWLGLFKNTATSFLVLKLTGKRHTPLPSF